MRTAAAVAGILVLAQAAPLWAQIGDMAVAVPEVEVRSGAGQAFAPTGRLRLGDRVTVVPDAKLPQPGWLASKPPDGSYSWINKKDVMPGQNPQLAAVIGPAPVPVRAGGAMQKPLDVESATLPPGSVVVILDKEVITES